MKIKILMALVAIMTAITGISAPIATPVTPVEPSIAPLAVPDSLKMVASYEASWAYAVSMVRSINVWTYAPSTVGTQGSQGLNFAGRKNSVELGAILAQLDSNIQVVNPDESISHGYYMSSAEGDTMFYGQESISPEYTAGHWKLPDNAGYIEPQLAYEITIHIPDLVGARIVVLNNKGSTERVESLYAWDGKFNFPTTASGSTNAFLVLDFFDKSTGQNVTAAYSLTGKGERLQSYNLFVKNRITKFGPIQHYDDPIIAGGLVQTIDGVGVNPLFEVSMSQSVGPAGKSVIFAAWTSDNKWPIGFRLWSPSKLDEWLYYPRDNNSATFTIKLEAGTTYYVFPVWAPGDFTPVNPPQVPYYWWNGKG